jgi:hypothetical protein
MRGIAVIVAMCASAGLAIAQPAGDEGAGSGAGSGSGAGAGSGSGSGSDAAAVKDPAVAKKWLAAAQVLVQRGDYYAHAKKDADAKAQYENAVTAYEKAIEASDDKSLYYSLALVEEKRGSPAAAYRDCKLVVDPKAGVKPDMVKKAQAKLDELSGKIGLVTLTVVPDGTIISLGDKQVAESPMTEPLALDPGTYALTLTAVGFQPKDTELKVEAGSESEHKIVLEPVKLVSRPPEEPVEATATAPPPDRMPLYIGAGAAGGLLLVATATGFAALQQHSVLTAPHTASVDRKDAQSNGRTLAHITDGCLGGAIAAAAFTVYWYRFRYEPQRRAAETEHAKLDVVPWVQPDAGGIFAVGSF